MGAKSTGQAMRTSGQPSYNLVFRRLEGSGIGAVPTTLKKNFKKWAGLISGCASQFGSSMAGVLLSGSKDSSNEPNREKCSPKFMRKESLPTIFSWDTGPKCLLS